MTHQAMPASPKPAGSIQDVPRTYTVRDPATEHLRWSPWKVIQTALSAATMVFVLSSILFIMPLHVMFYQRPVNWWAVAAIYYAALFGWGAFWGTLMAIVDSRKLKKITKVYTRKNIHSLKVFVWLEML